MSSGAVHPPFTDSLFWELGLTEFLHETAYYIIPPGMDLLIRWAPEEPDRVFKTFALTFGKPRNYYTGEVTYTDMVGVFHRGTGMKTHWDPLVESVAGIVYPHLTPSTIENPFEIRLVNRTTDLTIIIDISVWFFDYHKKDYEKAREVARGIINFFRLFGKVKTLEEAEGILRLVRE